MEKGSMSQSGMGHGNQITERAKDRMSFYYQDLVTIWVVLRYPVVILLRTILSLQHPTLNNPAIAVSPLS